MSIKQQTNNFQKSKNEIAQDFEGATIGTQINVKNIFHDWNQADAEVETIIVEYGVFAPSPFEDTYYEIYFEHKEDFMHYTIENSPYLLNEIYNIKAEAMMIDKPNKIFKIKLDFIYKSESSYNGIEDDYKQYQKEEKLQVAKELNNHKIKIKAIELFLSLIYKNYNFAHTTDKFYLAVIGTILNFTEYDHDHVNVCITHRGKYIFRMKTSRLFIPSGIFTIKNIEQSHFNNFYYEYIAYLLINYISNPKLDIANLMASETIYNLFFEEERLLGASWVQVKPDN